MTAYLENNEEAQDFADTLLDRFREPVPDRPWSVEDVPLLESLGFDVEITCKPYPWGWRELHPPSFWGGFLLSSAFWLSIGIALQIISR